MFFYFQPNGWSTESTQIRPDGKILLLPKPVTRRYYKPPALDCTHMCIQTITMCTFEYHLWNCSNKYTAFQWHECIPRSIRLKLEHAPTMPSWPAVIITLTRTTSSSLFLCMSCFSSSTILDMASFSVSCSFSDNCQVLKGKWCHNTGSFWSGPWFSESVAQSPLGDHQSPACIPQVIFWKW